MSGRQSTLPDGSYLTLQQFTVPTEDGDVWAMAFSNSAATILAAALTIFITTACLSLWTTVCFIALYFSKSMSWGRYIAFVTLWNSNDPWFAFRHMASNSMAVWRQKGNRRDAWYNFTIAFIAFVIFFGALAAGIVGPSYLEVGNFAPVRPSMVYYPAPQRQDDNEGLFRRFRLLASTGRRAIGVAYGASELSNSKVELSGTASEGLNYKFKINGVDFSLQHLNELSVTVEGSCKTAPEWYDEELSTEDYNPNTDPHRFWGNDSYAIFIPHYKDEVRTSRSPRLYVLNHPEVAQQFETDDKMRFALGVDSVHHQSYTRSSDPWYTTEQVPPKEENSADDDDNSENNEEPPTDEEGLPDFHVKRGRPMLDCWERNTWAYKGRDIGTFRHLNGPGSLDGPDIPPSVLQVFSDWFTEPTVSFATLLAGDSALLCGTTGTFGMIDANDCSVDKDVGFLVHAAHESIRSAFTNTILFRNTGNHPNAFRQDGGGAPVPAASQIVVSGPEVRAFSLIGVITVCCAMVVFLFVASFLSWWVSSGKNPALNDKRGNRALLVASSLAGGPPETLAPITGKDEKGNITITSVPATKEARPLLERSLSSTQYTTSKSSTIKVISPVELLHCALGNPTCNSSKNDEWSQEDQVVLSVCSADCKGHLKLVKRPDVYAQA